MRGNSKTYVVVVDDDECIRSAADAMLRSGHYECLCFSDGESCLAQLPGLVDARKCDLLITDVRMPGKSGMDVLVEALRIAPWCLPNPIIIILQRPLSIVPIKRV